MERTLPYSWYSDLEILRREQQQVVRPSWQYAGHLGQLPEPGAFFTGRPNISIGPVVPLTPDRSYRFLDYFFGPDVDQTWIDDLMAFDDQVGLDL